MAQVKRYLDQTHQRLRQRVEHALTHDGWGEAQILPTHVETLEAIMCYAQGLDPDLSSKSAGETCSENGPMGQSSTVNGSESTNLEPTVAAAPLKSLRFRQEEFHVPNCVLEVLAVIRVYLQCTRDFSAHVVTIMHQMLELLGHFNMRTTELILGTGALAL